ncbi:MAG: hypothetical protein M0035_03680, partial [Actinomycetota bacterium]|nr:hypothetical protein [Actinomycetota bacterium]
MGRLGAPGRLGKVGAPGRLGKVGAPGRLGKVGAPGRLGKLGAPEGGVTQTCTPFELLALSDTPAPLPDADTLTPAD